MKLELYKVPEFKTKSIRIEKQVLKDAEDLAALCNRKTADFLSVLIEKEVKRLMQEPKFTGDQLREIGVIR